MSAATGTPIKKFNFGIEIAGIDQLEFQDITVPDVDLDVVEHGAGNYTVKTAGLKKVGTGTLKRLKFAESANTDFVWNWLNAAQNSQTGGGGLAIDYKLNIVFKQYAPNNVTVLAREIWVGAWVSSYKRGDFSRTSSDNVVEELTIQVDDIIPA